MTEKETTEAIKILMEIKAAEEWLSEVDKQISDAKIDLEKVHLYPTDLLKDKHSQLCAQYDLLLDKEKRLKLNIKRLEEITCQKIL